MDKNEYKLKTEQMLELMEDGAYRKAAEIADTIDWKRVRNAAMLANVSDIYEKIKDYQKSYEVLNLAYRRAEGSRKVISRLCTLALKTGNVDEAIDYYDDFIQIAPKDPNQYILRYQILRAQRSPIEQQIEALEEYKKSEYIEEWAYELAKLYQEAGMTAECLEECDDLILWFSEGQYVYKAMELKMQYKPLTPSQQEKYDKRYEKLSVETEEMPDIAAYAEAKAEAGRDTEESENTADAVTGEGPVSTEISEDHTEESAGTGSDLADGTETSAQSDAASQNIEAEEFPKKKKIGDTMPLDEALRKLLHPESENIPAETEPAGETVGNDGVDTEEDPELSDLEKAIDEIESVADMDVAARLSDERKKGAAGEMTEITPDSFNAEDDKEIPDSDQITGQMSLEDILSGWEEGAKTEDPEELTEDVVEELTEDSAEDLTEEKPADKTPILPPDIQRMIDEIEGVIPAEEERPAEKSEKIAEKKAAEPTENMGEVADSLRIDDEEDFAEELFDDEEEDYFDAGEDLDEDFFDEEDELVAEDEPADEEYFDDGEDLDDEDLDEEEYFDDGEDLDEEEYFDDGEDLDEEEYFDDGEEPDEEEYFDDSDESDEDLLGEDEEELIDEEFIDEELLDEEAEEYIDDGEDSEEDFDEEEEDFPDIEEEFRVDPEHAEMEDDREIPDDDDDNMDILSATTPLSRKETAKMIATGKTAPLPLDEISDALSMSDTGFIVHGRYELETQSGIGTRAGLTEEQKKLFSYFVPVRGMSEQLVDVLEQDKNCTNRNGTSKSGNLLIIGNKGNGKTVLAVDVVKAIQKQRNIKQGKVAIVTGDSLNKKKISDIFAKLYGGALIIEKAGKMNEKTVARLNKAMESDTGELLIVLEEQRKPLDRLLTSNREFRRKFTSRLEIPIFINDELVTFGQTYAQENGYRIDEMGILALYSKIDSLQREDHAVTVAEVKEIMDEAIGHSQKASAKKLMKRVFGKNTDEADRIFLSEKDFNI